MSSSILQLREHFSYLTPIRTTRKKRPSLSPVKSRQPLSKPRTQSETGQPKPIFSQPENDIATSSLNFEEFSYWDTDSQILQNISSNHTTALVHYLLKKYGVHEMQESLPFLILWCRGGIPPQDKRPFSIAGYIAVWLNEGDPVPGDISIGDWGEADDIVIDDDLAADLLPFHMPKDETLLHLATQYFADSTFISFISHSVIVEYPKVSEESWYDHLNKLPSGLRNTGISLTFCNEPLLTTELKRLKTPKPAILANLQEDDSDYVKSQGCFFPGVMLQAASGNQISAGIAVEKGSETRLSVAFHCWEQEYTDVPDKLGDLNHFPVIQGETPVGYVRERIGTTDIGLVQLKEDVVFHNRFLDIPTAAKILLPLAEVNINDEFLIDSFVTGRQRLRCLGKRIQVEGERQVLKSEKKDLPEHGRYIQLKQGVYATGAPEIYGVPKIRAGVCGSAVVRVKKLGHNSGGVLENGEVSGFMHWSDLQMKNDTQGRLMCFADSVDDLITAGWGVVKVAEKHKAPDEEAQASNKRR